MSPVWSYSPASIFRAEGYIDTLDGLFIHHNFPSCFPFYLILGPARGKPPHSKDKMENPCQIQSSAVSIIYRCVSDNVPWLVVEWLLTLGVGGVMVGGVWSCPQFPQLIWWCSATSSCSCLIRASAFCSAAFCFFCFSSNCSIGFTLLVLSKAGGAVKAKTVSACSVYFLVTLLD